MKNLQALGIIAALIAAAAAITWLKKGPPPTTATAPAITCDPATIPPEEICLNTILLDWKNQVLWLDARSREEWQKNGIKDSLLLTNHPSENYDELLAQAAEKISTSPHIIIYCSDTGCGTSKEIAKRIKETGLCPSVHALHGGWQTLHQAGLVQD